MKVQVRKCRFTGKIFEETDLLKYKKHLLALRKEMAHTRYLNKVRKEFSTWLQNEKQQIKDIDDILPWFLKNQKYIMSAYESMNNDKFRKLYDTDVFENLSLNARYSDRVSNSHRCPANGVTNFFRKDNLPLGYRGYSGHLTGCLIREEKNKNSYPVSSVLTFIGIQTGTGGGGNESWGYHVEIFLDDWPGIAEELEGKMIVDKLKGIN